MRYRLSPKSKSPFGARGELLSSIAIPHRVPCRSGAPRASAPPTSLQVLRVVRAAVPPTGDDLQTFRILRVLRTFRLIKLARLVRASRLAKRWANRLSINYARLALFGAIGSLVPLSHWVACFWAAVGYTQVFLGADINDTWLGTKGFCWSVDSGGELPYACFDAWKVYAASLYFAGTTITSIGCARARA